MRGMKHRVPDEIFEVPYMEGAIASGLFEKHWKNSGNLDYTENISELLVKINLFTILGII